MFASVTPRSATASIRSDPSPGAPAVRPPAPALSPSGVVSSLLELKVGVGVTETGPQSSDSTHQTDGLGARLEIAKRGRCGDRRGLAGTGVPPQAKFL